MKGNNDMRRPLVAGNWKMNGTREGVVALIEGIKAGLGDTNADVLVCPPAIFIDSVGSLLEGSQVKLGAQNICQEAESGAYTGELSAAMLTEFGCSYAIIGHSERRHVYGEADKLVAERVAAAVSGNVTPIFCIGELLEEREKGTTEQVIAQQLMRCLSSIMVLRY